MGLPWPLPRATASIHPLGSLEEFSAFNRIWNGEPHILNQRVHFLLELPACLAVAASLQPPMAETVGALGVRTAEHIQRFDVPKIHALLHALARLVVLRC